jgi:hypothetical protein
MILLPFFSDKHQALVGRFANISQTTKIPEKLENQLTTI